MNIDFVLDINNLDSKIVLLSPFQIVNLLVNKIFRKMWTKQIKCLVFEGHGCILSSGEKGSAQNFDTMNTNMVEFVGWKTLLEEHTLNKMFVFLNDSATTSRN